MNFVEICNVCTKKVIIKGAKRIFNSDKICRSYCDFYFGVTFLEHTVYTRIGKDSSVHRRLRPVWRSKISAKAHRCDCIHQLLSRLSSMLVKRGEQLTKQTVCSTCSTEDVCVTYWGCHGRTI